MAGAMDLKHNEDPKYYRAQYKAKLLPLIRELRGADEEPVSSFMCLLKKKKEAQCMENALTEKEEAFRERMEVLSGKWRDLSARRAQLKVHEEASKKTIQENEMLQDQALKKASKDRKENMKREKDLLRAKEELEALKKEYQKLCKKLLKYSVFKKYLEDVVEISEFRDIEEVISFFKILMRSRKDLLQSQQWHKQITEQAKALLDKYTAEKAAEMQQYKNNLVQLKKQLDQARSDIPLWEGRWADIQNTADKNAMKLTAIKMTIHSLFQAASTQLNKKWRVSASHSHKQLEMIMHLIQDLSDITAEDIRKYK